MEFDVHSLSEVEQVLDRAREQRPDLAGWRFTLQSQGSSSVELVATTEAGSGSWKMTVPLDGTANSADVERAVIALLETAGAAIKDDGPVSTPWLRA
jgi:hypothetical protein